MDVVQARVYAHALRFPGGSQQKNPGSGAMTGLRGRGGLVALRVPERPVLLRAADGAGPISGSYSRGFVTEKHALPHIPTTRNRP